MRWLADWLDIRRDEIRPFALASAGAFLTMAFVVFARAIREAAFLANWEIEKLPWMIAAVVLAGLPAVIVFGQLLSRWRPARILAGLSLLLAAGIAALWWWNPGSNADIILYFLWTAVGTLLLTSGLWTVISEVFPLRGAKRLFSLIGAGGTIGAMAAGVSLSQLTQHFEVATIAKSGIGLLVLLAVVFEMLGRAPARDAGPAQVAPADPDAPKTTPWRGGRRVWRNTHLRGIATLIFLATLFTTLVDFQFKDLARAEFVDSAQLAGFLGSFYGWAGLVSLALQIFVAGRLLERGGFVTSLAVSPALLFGGVLALLLAPGLGLATLVRGADYSLRKSLLRPAIEVLYVPVPSRLRRETKVFIDSMVDSAAEGMGAALIVLWVTVLALPARSLAIPALLAATVFLALIRSVNRSYQRSVSDRLLEEGERYDDGADSPLGRELFGATFTNLDLTGLLHRDSTPRADEEALPPTAPPPTKPAEPADPLWEGLSSPDDAKMLVALEDLAPDDPEQRRTIARWIARDDLFRRARRLLPAFPSEPVAPLIAMLRDEGTDFVVRRRIPEFLARTGGSEADAALLDVLEDRRFEVRYRAAMALSLRRKQGLPAAEDGGREAVWRAIAAEVTKDRPVWELQKLLDDYDSPDDGLLGSRVGVRGELSLEHTFRLLTLVLNPTEVRAAYHGVVLEDARLKSYALEYLEQVLPANVRDRLWLFIGDVSVRRQERQMRPLEDVVADIIATGQTLIGRDFTNLGLRDMAGGRERSSAADRQDPDGDSPRTGGS